jgi:hypothetical protein
MVAVAPPKPQPPALQAQKLAEPGPAAQAAEQLLASKRAQAQSEVLPDHLDVRLDEQASRFVQTITDAQTNEMKLRFPSEGQLAYARAVKAYLKAQFGR